MFRPFAQTFDSFRPFGPTRFPTFESFKFFVLFVTSIFVFTFIAKAVRAPEVD
jgi:hypothetical protein